MPQPNHTRAVAHRKRHTWRARSALAWGLGGFLLLQLVLIFGIDHRLPELRDVAYAQKIRRLRHRTEETPTPPLTVVMLGSSRTVFGLKAGRLEKPLEQATGRPAVAFNFGMYGAGPVMNLVTLRRLLSDGVRPDLVLIEVLPPLLTDKPHTHEVNRIPADLLGWSDLQLVERFGRVRPGLRHDWWMTYPVPSYSHRFAIVSRVAPGLLPWRLRLDWFSGIDDSGSVEPPAFLASDEHRTAALNKAREEYADFLTGFHLGGPGCDALRESLEICRREGIPAALVLMPEGTDFRSWYRPADWACIEAFLADLSREYAAPVVNAREWIADKDFTDSHHLLHAGAVQFTDRLGREVLPELLRQRKEMSGGQPAVEAIDRQSR
jgi:hypothetical protein